MDKKIATSLFLAILLALPAVTLAADLVIPDPPAQGNAIDFWKLVNGALGVIWPIFIGAVVIMIIWAGFLFVTAAGDPAKITTAKKAAIWAVVGIAVGLLAFSAYTFVKRVLGA